MKQHADANTVQSQANYVRAHSVRTLTKAKSATRGYLPRTATCDFLPRTGCRYTLSAASIYANPRRCRFSYTHVSHPASHIIASKDIPSHHSCWLDNAAWCIN